MNLFQSILYGLISGLSEFMPASSRAHQYIILELFGGQVDPVMDFFVHLAILFALYFGARNLFDAFIRERRIASRRSRRSSARDYTNPFIRTASVTLIISYVCLTYIFSRSFSLLAISGFCLINGIILFVPDRLIQSNKSAQHMTTFDSMLTGFFGALSAFPGISRVGASNAYAIARGAGRQHAFNWSLLISLPSIALLLLLDVIGMFTGALPITFMRVLGYLLAAGFAYLGAHLSISIMKFLAVKIGFSAFSYYSWGMALFTFILYLI